MNQIDFKKPVFTLDTHPADYGAIEIVDVNGKVCRLCYNYLYELRDICYRMREICDEADEVLKAGGVVPH